MPYNSQLPPEEQRRQAGMLSRLFASGKPPVVADDHDLMCPANGKPERREDCNCGETARMKKEGLI